MICQSVEVEVDLRSSAPAHCSPTTSENPYRASTVEMTAPDWFPSDPPPSRQADPPICFDDGVHAFRAAASNADSAALGFVAGAAVDFEVADASEVADLVVVDVVLSDRLAEVVLEPVTSVFVGAELATPGLVVEVAGPAGGLLVHAAKPRKATAKTHTFKRSTTTASLYGLGRSCRWRCGGSVVAQR